MDRITKNLIDDFLRMNEMGAEDGPKDFEKFSNYSIISKEYSETFDINDVATGKHTGINSRDTILIYSTELSLV